MRRELLLIREMIDAAQRAHALVAGGDAESLAADRQRGEALLWNFTVLGEAAAQLDETVKVRFRDVEWARPSQLRNRIIHGYWSISFKILHATATNTLPGFVAELRNVLAELEAEDA